MKTVTITLKLQASDQDIAAVSEPLFMPTFDMIGPIQALFKKQNKLHLTSHGTGPKGIHAVVEGFITTVLQPEPAVPHIEVYVVEQCKNIEVWVIMGGRVLEIVKDQYSMDTRLEFRTNNHLKGFRLDRKDWPDAITTDFDFKRHQQEEDSLQLPEDPEEADVYVTKIYRLS